MQKNTRSAYMALLSLSLVLSACSSTDTGTQQSNKAIASLAAGVNYAEIANARQKLQWTGVYQGIFPCTSCEGIATMLTIKPDMSFSLRTRELGREDIDKKSEGKFVWLSDNSHIQLQGTDSKRVFRIGDGFMELMGANGKPVTTANRKDFILEKTD